MIYGYARVSTDGQSVAAQVAELTKAGAVRLFRETASGAQTDRTQLRKVLTELDSGDVLMVTRLDRLARSTRDLLNILATITDRKAGFRSLGDAWADTTTAHGRLMVTVLGGLAEFERDLIRSRTGEGRKRAIERGVKMGRPPKLTSHQKKEARRRIDAGETTREIALSYTRITQKSGYRFGFAPAATPTLGAYTRISTKPAYTTFTTARYRGWQDNGAYGQSRSPLQFVWYTQSCSFVFYVAFAKMREMWNGSPRAAHDTMPSAVLSVPIYGASRSSSGSFRGIRGNYSVTKYAQNIGSLR